MAPSIRFTIFMRQNPAGIFSLPRNQIIFRKFCLVSNSTIADFEIAGGPVTAIDNLVSLSCSGFEADAITACHFNRIGSDSRGQRAIDYVHEFILSGVEVHQR